ncbi:MAG: biopolymer transporter ExbD [Flavobacteriales bacterium]|nr:biopolymer transporter ExbD [Flavobacteriales bacterium]
MPKIKMPRSSPSLDMTPMVDLAFLLVTFFILTSSFRAPEPVQVITPSSTSDKLMPENAVLITISDSGKVFFNINGSDVRIKVLEKMSQKYKIDFTKKEYEEFSGMASIGVGMKNLKKFINTEPAKREKFKSTGIPMDSLNNQLRDWIQAGWIEGMTKYKELKDQAKESGKTVQVEPLRFAIKADGKANYIVVKEVIKTFTDLRIFRFNLLTNFEQSKDE